MPRPITATAGRTPLRATPGLGLTLTLTLTLSAGLLTLTGGADPGAGAGAAAAAPAGGVFDLDVLSTQARAAAATAVAWYHRTPPADRVTWGGLVAAAGLGLGVLAERWLRLRPRRIVPDDFSNRFLERLQDGRLDRGKALDYCELHVSPASRVAIVAVKRWGRPVADLERAVSLAHRVESERLRRHVGTLRRIAALTPLLGLLGTLTAVSRTLATLGATAAGGASVWGPALATALWPVTAGVALATLALVAYDGLAGRVEQLSDGLDRIGAETIDAIALAMPLPTPAETRPAPPAPSHHHGPHTALGSARTPHQIRLEVPGRALSRTPLDDDDDLD